MRKQGRMSVSNCGVMCSGEDANAVDVLVCIEVDGLSCDQVGGNAASGSLLIEKGCAVLRGVHGEMGRKECVC